MTTQDLFKWRHFLPDVILLNVRWYCRYSLSYRDLQEMMAERGIEVDHTTIFRWVQDYAPELDQRIRPHLLATNDSWRVDETYSRIKGKWRYLYRAVDSEGNTLDFMLSPKRDAKAAKHFFNTVLRGSHVTLPRVINVDKNPAYPPAVDALKEQEDLPEEIEVRPVQYLNNLVEPDPRFVKRRINPGLGFGSLKTAQRNIRDYEAMDMIRKGQIKNVAKGYNMGQISFINPIFGIAG